MTVTITALVFTAILVKTRINDSNNISGNRNRNNSKNKNK